MTAPDPRDRDPLDRWISAATEVADHDLRRASRPAFIGVVARARRRESASTQRRWLVPLLAAAAVLLAFGVQRGLARRDPAEPRAFQAGAQPDPAPLQPLPAPPPRAVHPDPAPIDPAPNPPRVTAPRERLEDLLARLDDEAEARMQAGDLAGADARYKEIVQRGGRRVQVELAFADRFHLARQRRDDPALRKLWTAYLARFPRGQFADDARGGLCRHADDAARPACWRDYLADFPSGSFAAEAAQAGGAE
jgi:hypothetical protein